MPAYFLDSSATVKRYAAETGSAWILSLFRPKESNVFYAARITQTECVSSMVRKRRGKVMTAKQTAQAVKRFRKHFQDRFFKIEIDAQLIDRATELAEKYFLRGYDAVQLAAALKANADRISIGLSSPVFVSADNALNNAASAEGLTVDNPNLHP